MTGSLRCGIAPVRRVLCRLRQFLERDDWKSVAEDQRATEIESLFQKVKPQLSKNKPASKGSNEDAVRDQFLNHVFDILGLPWSPSVRHFDKELDYAIFPDSETLAKAQSLINEGKELEALKKSRGIVEAERGGKEFTEKPKKSDLSDPIFQIEFYLQNAHRSGGPRWGILTKGHTWRLYCGDSDPLRHDYLEIELPTQSSLFDQERRQAFSLLVYFFSVEALRSEVDSTRSTTKLRAMRRPLLPSCAVKPSAPSNSLLRPSCVPARRRRLRWLTRRR